MATGRLVAQGLIDPRGFVRPDLHQAMTAFALSGVEIDLRFAAGRGVLIRGAVVVHDGVAFLAVVTNGHIRFSRVPAEAALPALVGVVPPRPPARGTLVTLPLREVDDAVLNVLERGTADGPLPEVVADETYVATLVRRGVALTDAQLFARLAGGRRLRAAEFGVTVKDRAGHRRRCPRDVLVVDTPGGRTVVHTRGDYVTAAPADDSMIIRVLAELRDAELDRLGGNRLG